MTKMSAIPTKKARVFTAYPATSPCSCMRAAAPLVKTSTKETYSMTPAEKPVATERKR